MSSDTLQGGYTVEMPKSQDTTLEDDDREVTAITALEIETSKTKETLARLRDSQIARPIVSAGSGFTPIPKAIPDEEGSWNTRPIYNNSIFDIGMARTLFKNQSLILSAAIDRIVKQDEGVSQVNITLIEGSIKVTSSVSRYRFLEQCGQTITFSTENTDFSTVELSALSERTRILLLVWRSDGT